MSDDIVNWLSDTAIAFAKREGVDDGFEEEIEDINTCESVIEYEYIPIPI